MLFLPLLFAQIALQDRVVVVENTQSPASIEIAADYMAKRKITNVVKVQCQDSALSPENETMPYATFVEVIQDPLRQFLANNKQIDFIVLTKGIPIRLTGAPFGMGGNQPSLDSALAAMDYAERKDAQSVTLKDSGFTGKCWINNYWNAKERFSHEKFGGYLVTRLDGYTVDEAKRLTTLALNAEKQQPVGKILLDVATGFGIGQIDKAPLPPASVGNTINEMEFKDWNADLVSAGMALHARGLPSIVDRTDQFIGGATDLDGYFSWGSNDPKFDAQGYRLLRFAPGALAETAVSTGGRTFLPTTGGQSLIADLIHAQVTGIKGYCDEPLLQAIASPSILFDRYTSGWTLAESYYAASRFVGWEDIVIGDPLCAPYQER